MLNFVAEGIDLPNIDSKQVTAWIKTTATQYGKAVGNINFIFCSDEKILEVNKQFLQHDYYTDIITFDYSTNQKVAGDIFISIDTVRSNADSFRVNFRQELHRIIIHGVLHLCGQHDKTPDERAEMTRKEDLALSEIIIQ